MGHCDPSPGFVPATPEGYTQVMPFPSFLLLQAAAADRIMLPLSALLVFGSAKLFSEQQDHQ